MTLADAPPAGPVPSDFNGDVSSDVLWQHASGFMADWQINGGQITNNSGVAIPIPTLRFQDTGDFNGDGRADVLLRHDNGQVALWTMNGAQIVSSERSPRSATTGATRASPISTPTARATCCGGTTTDRLRSGP